MKIFLAFLKKEVLHILRDTRTLVILFGMPVVLVLIFGYTVTNEFKGASVGIIDQAKDHYSESLISKLGSSGHFSLVVTSNSHESMEQGFKDGAIKMALIIPAGFGSDFENGKAPAIQLIADATEPNYATTLVTYGSQMIRSWQKENGPGFIPIHIDSKIQMLYNPKLEGAYNFIPGVVALILMLICAMMTSLTIAREKESGTMDLLLASPLSPAVIILGKVAPYAILSFLSSLTVFGMGYFIFDVPIKGSLLLLLALTTLYLLVALALGVLISTKAANQQAAMMMSMFALLMPTMLLSGFIFPTESMPLVLQTISRLIPAKYFILIEKAIMLKGAGFEAVLFPTAILGVMLLVLLIAARKNFKLISK